MPSMNDDASGHAHLPKKLISGPSVSHFETKFYHLNFLVDKGVSFLSQLRHDF